MIFKLLQYLSLFQKSANNVTDPSSPTSTATDTDTIVNSMYSNIIASEVHTPVRPQVLTHAWNINESSDRHFAETGGQTASSFNDVSSQSSIYFLPAIQYVEAYEIQTENDDENEIQIENDTQIQSTEQLADSTDIPYSNHFDNGSIQDELSRSNEEESSFHDNDNVNTSRGRVGSPYRGRERGSGSGSNRRNPSTAVYMERNRSTGQLPVAEAVHDPSEKTLEETLTSLPPIQDPTSTPSPTLPLSLPTVVVDETPPLSLTLAVSENLTLIPESEPSSSLHLSTVVQSLTPSQSSFSLTLLAPPVSTTTTTPSIPTLPEATELNVEVQDLIFPPPSSPSSSSSSSSRRSIRGNITLTEGEEKIDVMQLTDQSNMSRSQTSDSRPSETISTWLIFVSLLFITVIIAIFGITAVSVRTNNGIDSNSFQPILRNRESNLLSTWDANNLAIENYPILTETDFTEDPLSGNLLVENDPQITVLSFDTDFDLLRSIQEIQIITETHTENDENEYSQVGGINGFGPSRIDYNEFATDITNGNYDRNSIDNGDRISLEGSFADDIILSENNILNGESIEEHAFRMSHESALRNEETERSGSTGGDPLIHIYTDSNIDTQTDIDIDVDSTILGNGSGVDSTGEEEYGVRVTLTQSNNENEIEIGIENGIENTDLWIRVRGFLVQVLSTFRHLHDTDSASDGILFYPDFCSEILKSTAN